MITLFFGPESLVKKLQLVVEPSPDNGAPCHIYANGDPSREQAFYDAFDLAVLEINALPDDFEGLRSEIKRDWMTIYYNSRVYNISSDYWGNHGITSGIGEEPSRGTDAISTADIQNIAHKFLRSLRENKGISEPDYKNAKDKLDYEFLRLQHLKRQEAQARPAEP